MADSLEVFLTKIRRDLASLPPDERERRLDSVTEQLADYMAAHLDRGMEEEAAAREAIRQFETRHRSAFYATLPSTRRFGLPLSPMTVTVLYCVVATKAVTYVFDFLFWLLAGPLLPSSSASWWISVVSVSTPSVLIAIAASFALLFCEGVPKIISTLISPLTVIGTGARWLVLRQAFLTVLTFALLLTFRSAALAGVFEVSVLQDSAVPLLIGLALLLLMPVAPFLAGWLVARASPEAGVQGVCIAATTSGLLSFVDQCSWQFQSPGDTSPTFRAALFALLLLGQVLLMGLAIAGARIGCEDAKARN